jgi:hypothetical protein
VSDALYTLLAERAQLLTAKETAKRAFIDAREALHASNLRLTGLILPDAQTRLEALYPGRVQKCELIDTRDPETSDPEILLSVRLSGKWDYSDPGMLEFCDWCSLHGIDLVYCNP